MTTLQAGAGGGGVGGWGGAKYDGFARFLGKPESHDQIMNQDKCEDLGSP